MFDFTVSLTKSYTFWSGVIGGAFLTTATHGTDQLMVQRYLCASSPRQARVALLSSGVVVFAQFVLFLLIGSMLYVYYTGHATAEMAAFTVGGRIQSDRIFPHFIVTHLPPGIVGLVIAAVFAAAMSTLSSSLNSSSATAMADFYMPMRQASDEHYLRVSRWLTAFWGVVQISVALVAIQFSTRAVDEVLGIASFTNGDHPRRVPPRHLRAARAPAIGIRGHPGRHGGDARRQDAPARLVAVVRADRGGGDVRGWRRWRAA